MKKLLLLLALTLAACTSAPKPYTEILLSKNPEFSYLGQDEAFAHANLLAKRGRELPTDVYGWMTTDSIQAHISTKLFSAAETQASLDTYCTSIAHCPAQSSLCPGMCQLFHSTGERIILAASVDRTKSSDDQLWYKYNSHWSVFDGEKELFSAPMSYGPDGVVHRVEIINEKPAVTFTRSIKPPVPGEVQPTTTSDLFYDGVFFNQRYGMDGSHSIFTYRGKIGFVGTKDGKEFIYFDGKPVSPAFDAIRTESCCSMPSTQLRVFDNGALVFVGERDGYGILTEIDLKL
ncbi:MAG: hypothetical protein WCG83_03475 [Candidatus Peregrinibacteria bacterium]